MRLLVLGAGSVGLNLGARLARAGCQVHFVVRDPDVAQTIRRDGICVVDPESDETWTAEAEATPGVESVGALLRSVPVLLCTRASETESLGAAVARVAPGATLVSAQNDVDNEETLARHESRVVGLCLRQTCTRVGPNSVRTLGRGRLILGAHPDAAGASQETGDVVEALANAFRLAQFDVGISEHITEDKWLKLCVNLMSAPNALVVPDDHKSWSFVEIKARLLEEARTALCAAGIRARSCDGRDRSLEQEILYQRESLALGTSARRVGVYNAVWTALRNGAPLEADLYHRRILDLAAAHGLAAPTNTRVLEELLRAWQRGLGPESMRASELLAARSE